MLKYIIFKHEMDAFRSGFQFSHTFVNRIKYDSLIKSIRSQIKIIKRDHCEKQKKNIQKLFSVDVALVVVVAFLFLAIKICFGNLTNGEKIKKQQHTYECFETNEPPFTLYLPFIACNKCIKFQEKPSNYKINVLNIILFSLVLRVSLVCAQNTYRKHKTQTRGRVAQNSHHSFIDFFIFFYFFAFVLLSLFACSQTFSFVALLFYMNSCSVNCITIYKFCVLFYVSGVENATFRICQHLMYVVHHY